MVIVNIINSILQAMVDDPGCELKSWQYNDLSTSNVRLDSKKQSPTAVFLQISDWTFGANALNVKESADINISFLEKEGKLDAGGIEQDQIIDRMKALAIDFIQRLKNVSALKIEDDEYKIKSVFLRSDSNRSGVNLQLAVKERQGECINGTYNPVMTVTENGLYNVAGYTQIVVDIECPEPPVPPAPGYICFTSETAGTKIGMAHNGTNQSTTAPNIYWTTDLVNIHTWDFSEITLENVGDKVYFYGHNPNGIGRGLANFSTFIIEGKASVSGDITRLLYPEGLVSLNIPYAFNCLFYGCAGLVNATQLQLAATRLSDYCYRRMFEGCTSLTAAPELPATTLKTGCYLKMFRGCTSLTTAPVLPATALANNCYEEMFLGCTSITTAPALPATTMKTECYDAMFYGCTSLVTPPSLPATALAERCYDAMFSGCTSLTSAPELPATTLKTGCYLNMFRGCTSLTTAPVLPATTLASSCYVNMFRGCTSLNYIKVSVTNWNTTNAADWVNGVADTGTFYKPSTLTNIPTNSINGIPYGWTVINY